MFENSDELQRITYNLEKKIEEQRKIIEYAPTNAFMEMNDAMYQRFKNIFEFQLAKAINDSKEFENDILRDRLLELVNRNDIIKIIPQEDKKSIKVELALDEVAGTLEDYANGITYARNVIKREDETKAKEARGGKRRKKKKPPYDPIRASKYWAEHIYGTGEDATRHARYDYTMKLRLENFASLAPFWKILDKGLPQMASNRGGTAYPVPTPTDFVDATITQIEILGEEKLKEYYDEIVEIASEQIEDVSSILENIQDVITNVNAHAEKYTEPQIIKDLEIGNTQYYAYITQTGRLGVAQEPRAFGRRLLSKYRRGQ